MSNPLHVRWLGTVAYREALALQEALFEHGSAQHLLLLEHPHVVTYGPRADVEHNVLVDLAGVGADFVAVNRGGDVTYHGPGQLVGYPIVSLPPKHGSGTSGLADSVAYVRSVEQLVIDALEELGVVDAGRLHDHPGVWIDPAGPRPRKICAIGVRLTRGRTMHGFALNVAPDLRAMREWIVPCGIADKPVTSLAEEGVDVPMRDVVDVVSRLAGARWGDGLIERQDVAWRHRPDDLSAFSRGKGPGIVVRNPADHGAPGVAHAASPQPVRLLGRLADAGVTGGHALGERKPEWLRPKVVHGPEVLALKRTLRDLGTGDRVRGGRLPEPVGVLEPTARRRSWCSASAAPGRAGSAWSTPASRSMPTPDEPARVAEAVERMGLDHAVLTMVARDDLADGGMAHVAARVEAIRMRRPATTVETLDLRRAGRGELAAAAVRRPPRRVEPQRRDGAPAAAGGSPVGRLRPQPGVLAAAKAAGLTTKSGLIVGMGETDDEVVGTLVDLASHRGRHRDDRPVPATDLAPPARRALGRAGDVRPLAARSASGWASATSRPAR